MTGLTDYTLATLLDLLTPYIDARLVGPEVFATLRCVAQALPPLPGLLLECRLAPNANEVDLCLRAEATDGGRNTLAGKNARFTIPKAWVHQISWRQIRSFCEIWLQPDLPFYCKVETIWLEFDYRLMESAVIAPSFFALLPKVDPAHATLYEILEKVIPIETTLSTNPLVNAIPYIHVWLDGLPADAIPYSVGVMFSRPLPSIRLCIMLLFASLPEYLSHLGLDWAVSEIGIWQALLQVEPNMPVCLNIDIIDIGRDGNSPLLPVVGIELKPSSSAQEAVLVESLCRNGWCSLAKADALMKWSGFSAPINSVCKPLADVKITMLDHRAAYDSAQFVRRINHFKFVFRPNRAVEAKAYLYAGFGW